MPLFSLSFFQQRSQRRTKFFLGGAGLLLLWLSSTAYGGDWMGLFNRKETGCVFSGFEGQLLYEGQPAAGAVLTRKYELFGREGEDTATADSDGRFKFESVFWEYREPLLAPVGFIVYQSIIVTYNNNETQIWSASIRSNKEFSEFSAQPKNLRCELTGNIYGAEPEDGGVIASHCLWDNQPERWKVN